VTEYIDITLDMGNSEGKSIQVGKKHVQVMPHGLKFVSDTEWDIIKSRDVSQRGDNNTKKFYMDNRAAIVGKEAADSGAMAPRSGPKKYTVDYMRYIVAGQILKHYPKGTKKKIRVSIAHPPDAVPFRLMLQDAIGGWYRLVMPNGDKVKFLIYSVRCWDEPSGGVVRFLDNHKGNLNKNMKMLVVDIGGRVSSMTEVEMYNNRGRYELDAKFGDPTKHTTYYAGIIDIYESVERELMSLYGDLVLSIIPLNKHRDIITNIIKTRGFIMLSGVEHDVRTAYDNAVGPFESQFLRAYESMGSGLAQNQIVMTGGGSAALSRFFSPTEDYTSSEVDEGFDWLQHPYVAFADDLSQIHTANVRGGNILHKDILAREG
jgi:hypothetical protein